MAKQTGRGSPPRAVGSFRMMQDQTTQDQKRGLIPATVVHTNVSVKKKGFAANVPISTDGAPFARQEINLEWLLSKLKKAVPEDYTENREYYDGDHWRNGDGWAGPRPEANAADGEMVMEQILRSFTSKNCVREITNRKVNGVIGKEPTWHLTSRTASLDNKIEEIIAREAAASGTMQAPPVGGLSNAKTPTSGVNANGSKNGATPASTDATAKTATTPKPNAASNGGGSNAPTTPSQDAANPASDTTALDPAIAAAQQEQAMRLADLEDALTTWWDERQVHSVLDELITNACLAGRATIRIYVPPGLIDEGGALVTAGKTLRDTLKSIYIHAPDIDQCAVIRDTYTMRDMGIYHMKDEEGNEYAEVMYVNIDGVTIIREVATEDDPENDKQKNTIEDGMQMELGGRMLMYELKIPKLITDQVRQLQKLVNKSLTMGGENVNLAGFLERTILNGQLPRHVEEVTENGRTVKRFVRDKMDLGGGAVNSIIGVPMFGPENEFKGLATPNIVYRDPVGPEQFEKTVYMAYRALLEEVDQVHYLLSGEQYASGESRKQARADFIASLRKVRGVLNELGRWLIETVLAYGTWLANGGSAFEDLRAVFDARLDPGPATSDEINMGIQMHEAELLSAPTTMSWAGVDDVDAEMLLVQEEKKENHARAMEEMAAQTEQQIAVVGAKGAVAANGGGANNNNNNKRTTRPPRGAASKTKSKTASAAA